MSLVSEFNKIAEIAGVPQIAEKKVIDIEQDEAKYDITVWLNRRTNVKEFAGDNEDGYRWVIIHHGIKGKTNNKPF